LDLFFFSSVYSYFPLIRRVPTVLGIHDTIADRNPGFSFSSKRNELFWRWKVKFAISRADTVLTVSNYSRQCLTQFLGIPRERIRVMYEASSSRFRPVEAGAAVAPYILYVGGISPNKNLATLIRAYHALEARQRGVKLFLVGDYNSDGFKGCYTQLTELITSLHLAGDVHFLGYVPDEDLCALYNRASLFAMPSLDEGFGLPAVEAMACGIPVVVSTGNSLAEVVADAGVTIDPHDCTALTAAMDRILSDDDYASDLRRRSLRRAEYFSWDAAAQRLLEVFEETAKVSAK
jgi:glycosyltransferase involved in cell wall biosynthesis